MNIHVTYLCYFIFIQSQYKGILFRLTYLFVKCFPCNNKILHVRCSAPKMYHPVLCLTHNYVLSPFVSIASLLQLISPIRSIS